MGECLGCGATGAVYRALWQGTEVAVKQLSLFCLDSRHIADFYAEAAMLAGLSHPNVVRFYGVCADLTSRTTGRAQPSMVTEFMPAGSLATALRGSLRGHASPISAAVKLQVRGAHRSASWVSPLRGPLGV